MTDIEGAWGDPKEGPLFVDRPGGVLHWLRDPIDGGWIVERDGDVTEEEMVTCFRAWLAVN